MNYKFKVGCSKNKLQSIRQFIQQTLDNYSISEVDKCQLVLAVDEMCANLMIHSHHCNAEKKLELSITIENDEGITFEIFDQGKAFNILEYKDPQLEHIIKQKRKGGLGILLVKRIMDLIEFDYDANKKLNVCRLHKFIPIKEQKE